MSLQTSRPATMVDRTADVVKDKPVPILKTRNTPEPVDAFHMIFAKEMFELIMKNTNRKINNLLASVSEKKLQTYTFMKVTTLEEIHEFVGLLLYRRFYSLNNFTFQKSFLIYVGYQYLVQPRNATDYCFFTGVSLLMVKQHVPSAGNNIALLLQENFLNCSVDIV